jgi:hypothetical protein
LQERLLAQLQVLVQELLQRLAPQLVQVQLQQQALIQSWPFLFLQLLQFCYNQLITPMIRVLLL